MLAAIAKLFIPDVIGGVVNLAEKYLNKEITKAEFEAQTEQMMFKSFDRVETSHAAEITKGYAAFIGAAKDNQTLAHGWAWVLYSQLFVLLWHQLGIPLVVKLGAGPWPLSGSTVDWAYLLVALCLGGGAVLIRAGPGSSSTVDRLKALAMLKKSK